MVADRVQMRLLSPLRDRLLARLEAGSGFSGAVYGLEVDGVKIIVGAAGQLKEDGDKKQELELLNEMIPCGLEPMGVFGIGCREIALI